MINNAELVKKLQKELLVKEIYLAIYRGDALALSALLDEIDWMAFCEYDKSPLMVYLYLYSKKNIPSFGNDVVSELIAKTKNITHTTKTRCIGDCSGVTALMLACTLQETKNEELDFKKMIITAICAKIGNKAQLNTRDELGRSAYHIACLHGSSESVLELLKSYGINDIALTKNGTKPTALRPNRLRDTIDSVVNTVDSVVVPFSNTIVGLGSALVNTAGSLWSTAPNIVDPITDVSNSQRNNSTDENSRANSSIKLD